MVVGVESRERPELGSDWAVHCALLCSPAVYDGGEGLGDAEHHLDEAGPVRGRGAALLLPSHSSVHCHTGHHTIPYLLGRCGENGDGVGGPDRAAGVVTGGL